jgi:putative transposase
VKTGIAVPFGSAVILPDHLYFVWTLPPGDADFSPRVGMLKAAFTKAFLRGRHPPSARASRRRHRERDVWQRRFWEHTIRSERDLGTYMDYVHYNPVKHKHVRCPHAWPWSSFHHWVKAGRYPADWMCTCGGRKPRPPDFGDIEGFLGE